MKPKSTPHFSLGQTVFKAALVALGIISCGSLVYAVTAAGTSINNRATATYELGGSTHSVTSNEVITIVQAVGSFRLEADQTKYAKAGDEVVLPHQLINEGNVDLSVTLGQTVAGTVQLTNVDFYADTNQNGTYDTGTDLAISGPISLPADPTQTYNFFVVGMVPGSATNGTDGTVTITATGAGTGISDITKTNTDTIIINDNYATISVVKSISASFGAAGTGPYTYTLTVTNTGTDIATDILLYDALPLGMQLATPFPDPAWSGSGTMTKTGVAGDTTLTVLITGADLAAAGGSATLTFTVDVTATAIGVLSNTPKFCYSDANGVNPADCDGDSPSDGLQIDDPISAEGTNGNTVTFTITGLSLEKTQKLDADCNGCGGSGINGCTDHVSTNLAAQPGQCIAYKIVATNISGSQLGNVEIQDIIPEYTTLHCFTASAANDPTNISATRGTVTAPVCSSRGTITNAVGSLTTLNETATLKFTVKID